MWILYSKIKLTMHLYSLLHQHPLCAIKLYWQHLPLVLLQPLIVHSTFWLWTVQCRVLSWLPLKQRCAVRWWESYFKDKLQSLKKYYYASINWSMRNCTVERDSRKNRNQRVALLLMKLRRYYPFLPKIYSYERQL